LAIEAFTGRAPRGSLTVPNELAARLAEQLGADRILVAQLQQSPKRLMATGLVYGPAGKRVGRIVVGVAMGELSDMARQIAERLAPAIGATVVDGPAMAWLTCAPLWRHRRRCWWVMPPPRHGPSRSRCPMHGRASAGRA
jgi:hypothetical protein